jgi:hypothetical protein
VQSTFEKVLPTFVGNTFLLPIEINRYHSYRIVVLGEKTRPLCVAPSGADCASRGGKWRNQPLDLVSERPVTKSSALILYFL